jgi:hypothetical protein
MPVLRLAADESLVNLDHAAELVKVVLNQSRPDAVAHVPSRPVAAEGAQRRSNPDVTGVYRPSGLLRCARNDE